MQKSNSYISQIARFAYGVGGICMKAEQNFFFPIYINGLLDKLAY